MKRKVRMVIPFNFSASLFNALFSETPVLLYQLTHVISAGSFLNFAFLYAFLSFCSDSEPYLIRSIPAAGCFEEGLESPPPSYNSCRSTPLTTPAADHLEEDLESLPSYESCTSPSTLSTQVSRTEEENSTSLQPTLWGKDGEPTNDVQQA